jgi:hypothetical protein
MELNLEVKKLIPFVLIATLFFGLLTGLYILFGYSYIVIRGDSNTLFINNVTYTIPSDGRVKIRPGSYDIRVSNAEKEFKKRVSFLPLSSIDATPNKMVNYGDVINSELRSATYVYSSTKLIDSHWLVGCGSNGEDSILATMYYESGFWLPISVVSSDDINTVNNLSNIVPSNVFNSIKGCK